MWSLVALLVALVTLGVLVIWVILMTLVVLMGLVFWVVLVVLVTG